MVSRMFTSQDDKGPLQDEVRDTSRMDVESQDRMDWRVRKATGSLQDEVKKDNAEGIQLSTE